MNEINSLYEAVAAEKRDINESFSAQLLGSPVEQRRQGILLFPLSIKDQRSEGRRTLVTFQTDFPVNDTYFRRGCAILWKQEGNSGEGRLLELNERSGIFSVFEEDVPDLREEPVTLQFIPDDKTMKCMELGARLKEDHPQLLKFRENISQPVENFSITSFSGLNDSQSKAASAILSEKPVVFIQGPPGTGKTHTLAIAIRELVGKGKKVIISAPSNTAVDNLCHSIFRYNIPFLRVGNEEKMSAVTEQFTIDGYMDKGPEKKVLEHLQRSLRKADDAAGKFIRNFTREAAAEKAEARKERRSLGKEIRQLSEQAKKHLLETIPVIAGTPVGLFNELPKEFQSDIVIIDEAGQVLEPLTWLTASFGKKLVLCGDPMQLPPVVFSQKAKQLGLGRSLLETAMTSENTILLNEQYRMAPEIVAGINPHFYNDELITVNKDVAGKLIFIDMAGFGEGESRDDTSGSIYNNDEAGAVKKLIEEYDLKPQNTVVLSPYNAQLGILRNTLGTEWKVSTIDAIQGQEEENIIISLTRSNDEGEIGFLKDYRRTNVAISRAKKCCIIVGDSATLGTDPFYGKLIGQLENSGSYRSIWEIVS